MMEIEVTHATGISEQHELSFGNVYSGLIVAKSLWIHNTSEEHTVSVTLTASRLPFQGLDEDIDDFDDVTFESISSGHMGTTTENSRNVDGEILTNHGTSTRGNNYDNNANIIKRSKSSFLQKKYGPLNNPFLSYIAAKNPRAAVRKLNSTMSDLKKRGYNLDALIDIDDEESPVLGLDVPIAATTTVEMATELLPRENNNDDGSVAVNSTDLSTATIAAIDSEILLPTSIPDSLSLGTVEDMHETKYASYDPRYTRHRKDTGFRLTAEAAVGSFRTGTSSLTRRQPQSDDWRNNRRGGKGGGRDSYGTTSYPEDDAYDYGDDDDEYTMDIMGNKHSTPHSHHHHHQRKHRNQLADEPLSESSRCVSRSDSPLSDQPHHHSTRRNDHRHKHNLDSINTFVEMELTGDAYDSNRSYRLIHRNHRRNSHMPLLSPDDMDDDDYDVDNDMVSDTLPYHPLSNGDIDDQGQGLGESKNVPLSNDAKLRGQPSLRISTHAHSHLAHHATTQSVTLQQQQQGTTTNKKHGSGGATLSWVVQLSSVMFDDYSKNYHFAQHWQRGYDEEGSSNGGMMTSRYARQQQQPQSPVSRQFMHSSGGYKDMTLGKSPIMSAVEGSSGQHPTSSSSPSSSSKENHRKSSQSHHDYSDRLDLQGDSSRALMSSLRGGTIGETPSSSLPWTADRDTPDDTPDDSPRRTYDDGESSSNLGGDYLHSWSLRQRRDHDRSRLTSSSSELHHRRHRGRGRAGHRGRGLGPGNRSESLGESEGDFESSSGRGGGGRHDRNRHDDDDCDSDVYVASDAVGKAVLNTASAMFRGNHRHDGSHGLGHRRLDGPTIHRLHDGASGDVDSDNGDDRHLWCRGIDGVCGGGVSELRCFFGPQKVSRSLRMTGMLTLSSPTSSSSPSSPSHAQQMKQQGVMPVTGPCEHNDLDVTANPNSTHDRLTLPVIRNDPNSNNSNNNSDEQGPESEAAATAVSLTAMKPSKPFSSEEMVEMVRTTPTTVTAAAAAYAFASSTSSSSSSGHLYEGDPATCQHNSAESQGLPLVAGFGLEQTTSTTTATTVNLVDGELFDETMMGEEEAVRVAKSKEKQRRMTRHHRASPSSLRCLLRPGEKRLVRVLYCPSVSAEGSNNEGYLGVGSGAGAGVGHSMHHDQDTHKKNQYDPTCVLKARTFHIRISGRRALTKKQMLAVTANGGNSMIGGNNARNVESGSESGSESQSQLLSESEDERQSKRLPLKWGPPQQAYAARSGAGCPYNRELANLSSTRMLRHFFPSTAMADIEASAREVEDTHGGSDDIQPPPGLKTSSHPATPPSPRRLMANSHASTAFAPGSSNSLHWATHPLAHPSRPLHPHLLPPRSVNIINSPWVNARHLHNPSLNAAMLAHGLMRPDLMMIQQQHRHRHRGYSSVFPNPAHMQHRKLMADTADKNHASPAVQSKGKGYLAHRGQHHHHHTYGKEFTVALITCVAQVCTSTITVTPAVVDLGECNVGDFRVAAFHIRNESDVPALVIPFVESETLATASKDTEIHLGPREHKVIHMEYVARVVNTEYHKTCFLLNAYNRLDHHSVEVRAKNVDTHQVLLHSKYYQILTYNKRHQLQIFIDKCLINRPNVRVFTIVNSHSEPIELELIPMPLVVDKSDKGGNNNNEEGGGYRGERAGGAGVEDRSGSHKNDVSLFLLNRNCDRAQDKSTLQSLIGGSQLLPLDEIPWLSLTSSTGFPFNLLNTHTNPTGPSGHGAASAGGAAAAAAMSAALPESGSSHFGGSSVATSAVQAGDEEGGGEHAQQHQHTAQSAEEEAKSTNQMLASRLKLIKNLYRLVELELARVRDEEDGNTIEDGKSSPSPDALHQILTSSMTTTNLGRPVIGDILAAPSATNDNSDHAVNEKTEDGVHDVPSNGVFYTCAEPLHHVTAHCSNVAWRGGEGGRVTIGVGERQDFVVVFKPSPQEGASAMELGRDELTLSRYIQIKLGSLGRETDDNVTYPRSLCIRAKAMRSELSVLQKNINFGKMVIGESVSHGVTVCNRSALIPLAFNITKSSSYAAGFLRIPGGRKWLVGPLASVVVTFVFTPLLPGLFEETLFLENILEPANQQSIVIKARVAKAETFQLTFECGEPSDRTTVGGISAGVNSNRPQHGSDLTGRLAGGSAALDTGHDNRVRLGLVRLGTAAEVPLRIRIRNISQKPRQFNLDVDGGDVEVVSLGPSSPSNHPASVSAAAVSSTLPAAAQMASLSCRCAFQLVALEPRPPILHTLGGVPFSSDNGNAEGGGFGQVKANDPGGAYKTGGGHGGGSKTSEEQQVMEDKLEFLNQKLKIAVRKVKIDKVEKYRNKIRDMMTMLNIPQSRASAAYLEAEVMLATAAAEEQKQQALEGEGGAQDGVIIGDIADEGGNLVIEGCVEGARFGATAKTSIRTLTTDDDEGSLPGEVAGGMGALLASLVNESLGNNRDKGVKVPDPDAIPDHSHHSDVSSMYTSSNHNLSPRWSPRQNDLSASPALMMIQESATDESDDRHRHPSANPLMRSASHTSGMSTSPSTVANLMTLTDHNSSNSSNRTPLPAPVDFAPLTMVSQFQLMLSPGEERVVLAWVQIALTSESAEKTNAAAATAAAIGRNVITEALDGNEGIDDDDVAAAAALASAPQIFLVTGKVRVFEQRNQDLVRPVPFSCQVMFPFERQEPLTRVSPSRGGTAHMTSQEGEPGQATAVNDVGIGAGVTASEAMVSGGHRTAEVQAWTGSRFMEMPATTARRESIPAVSLPLLAILRIVDSAAATTLEDTEGQGAITPLAGTDATNTPVPSPRSLSRRLNTVIPAIVTVGSSSAVAMDAISEEAAHSPQHASAASNPVALNKPSHVPTFQLVTFPDLELDEVTGKWSRLELGSVQLPSTTASASSVAAFVASTTVYPFRVCNVSNRNLAVVAVSNLKTQVFLYRDEACTLPFLEAVMPKVPTTDDGGERDGQSDTTSAAGSPGVAPPLFIYLKLRPAPASSLYDGISLPGAAEGPGLGYPNSNKSLANGPGGSSHVTEKVSKATLIGRDLIGGIRLVFYDADTAVTAAGHGVNAGVGASGGMDGQTTDPWLPLERPKLSETTVVFRAVVGQSRLKARVSFPSPLQTMPHRVNLLPRKRGSNDRGGNEKRGGYVCVTLANGMTVGAVMGSLVLTNLSPTFPLDYQYGGLQHEGSSVATTTTSSAAATYDPSSSTADGEVWESTTVAVLCTGLTIDMMHENTTQSTSILSDELSSTSLLSFLSSSPLLDHSSLQPTPGDVVGTKAQAKQQQQKQSDVTSNVDGTISASNANTPVRLTLVLQDLESNYLPARQTRTVPYALLFPLSDARVQGLAVHKLTLINQSTQHTHTLLLSTFFDQGVTRQRPLRDCFPVTGKEIECDGEYDGDAEANRRDSQSCMPAATCDGTIVVALTSHISTPAEGSIYGSLAATHVNNNSQNITHDNATTNSGSNPRYQVSEVTRHRSSNGSHPSPSSLPTPLCRWLVHNDSDEALTVAPISNLPVAVALTMDLEDHRQEEDKGQRAMVTPPRQSRLQQQAVGTGESDAGELGVVAPQSSPGVGLASSASSPLTPQARHASNTLTAPAAATSCYDIRVSLGDLRPCGIPLTLPPHATAVVTASVSKGDLLSLELSGILHRLLEKCASGSSNIGNSGGRETGGLELSTSRQDLLASVIDTPTPATMTPSSHIAAASMITSAITAPTDVVAAALVPAPTVQMRGIVALQGAHSSDNNHSNYHTSSSMNNDPANDLPSDAVVNSNSVTSSTTSTVSSSSLMKLFAGDVPSPPTSPIRALLPTQANVAGAGKASAEGGQGAAAGSVDVAAVGMGTTGLSRNIAGGDAVRSSEDRDKASLLPAINRQVVSCMLLTLEFERR